MQGWFELGGSWAVPVPLCSCFSASVSLVHPTFLGSKTVGKGKTQTSLDTWCRWHWGLEGRVVPFSWSHPRKLCGRGGI